MKVTEIKNKEQWENFIIKLSPDSFLQSWNWGEFNEKLGQKIWRFGIYDKDELIAESLVILIKAKRGKFLFIPHGPIIKKSEKIKEIIDCILKKLKEVAKEEKADFVRISPLVEYSSENESIFSELKFKKAPIHMMHPEITWILDIEEDEESIMKNMRKTHRNLIRRATKEGVFINQGNSEEFLKDFYRIHTETVERHKFVPFSYEYIKNELNIFSKDDQVKIFNAEYQGEVISSAIIVFYGDEAFYHHGASSSKYSKIPSSYLTLFEAIKEAKRRNIRKFNFYGIVEDKPKHPWYGLSKFKKGFGGKQYRLVHCQDYPLNIKYLITYLIETIRKIKRGY